MDIIDLRSDTATHPTPEMRKAMAEAEVGDDMNSEDPTTNRLETMAADMLGKEAAVLVSSGTMGNLVSILTHCQRGDEIIIGDKSHIYRAEAGGASSLGGVAYHPLPNDEKGMLDPNEVASSIHPKDQHYSPTKMIALENTHNACNGSVLSPEDIKSVADVAHEHEIPLHVDGARIFNAAVYLETPVAELVKDADTVQFCLSKGLSAPIGSLVCGTNSDVATARRWRKTLGGAMRQVGVIAAAGIVSLESMVDRIAEDHSNARKLAHGLSMIPGINIEPDDLPTNLVFLSMDPNKSPLIAKELGDKGVKVSARPKGVWRLVTHSDISTGDIDRALDIIDSTFREHYPNQ